MASHKKQNPHTNPVTDKFMIHFKFSGKEKVNGIDSDFYNCCICSHKLNAKKKYNLVQHIKNVHRPIYDEVIDERNLPIKLERLKLVQNLVELVSLNGRPFTYLHDSGFQTIIQKDLDKFHDAGCDLSLSHPNFPEIKDHMHEMSEKVRIKIKEEVSGHPLSLLVDIVTKNRRSIFGMSIQFIINGQLKVRSIGMIELTQSHTAEYLSEVLCGRLKVFGIDLKQIISITTDNGSNVLKMVRDVETILKGKADVDENVPLRQSQPINDTHFDDQIANFLAEQEDMTDEEALSTIFDDVIAKKHENLLVAVCGQMHEHDTNILWDIQGVKCSAHIAQLSIKDSIQKLDKKHRNVIDLCRRVAKTLRLESVRNKLKSLGMHYKVIRMEIETRWGTLYLMVRKNYLL